MHRSPHGVGGSEVSAKCHGIWARGFSHGCSNRGFSIDIGDTIGLTKGYTRSLDYSSYEGIQAAVSLSYG